MNHSFWIVCCAALWLGLMTPLASAQDEDARAREQPVQEVQPYPERMAKEGSLRAEVLGRQVVSEFQRVKVFPQGQSGAGRRLSGRT